MLALHAPGDRAAAQALSHDPLKCYDVKRDRPIGVERLPLWVGDTPFLYDVDRLKRVCVPVTVDAEPPASQAMVACYRAKPSRGHAAPEPTGPIEVQSRSGFRWELSAGSGEYICVPAVVEVPGGRLTQASFEASADTPTNR